VEAVGLLESAGSVFLEGLDRALSICGLGIVGGFLVMEPWEVLELADPIRLMGVSSVSDPADPTRPMGASIASDPAKLTRLMGVVCVSDLDEVSSESDAFMEPLGAALLADFLQISPEMKVADSALSDPLVGLRVMVMLSGPLESELPRMNIF
jgi:hypothetical protein